MPRNKRAMGTEQAREKLLNKRHLLLVGEFRTSNDRYDYKCPDCGNIIKNRRYASVLQNGVCKACWINPKRITEEKLRLVLEKIDFEPVDFSQYKDQYTPIACICKKCGSIEDIIYGSVVAGKKTQCSNCSVTYRYGEFSDKPHVLYYLRIDHDGDIFYKIGITSQGIRKRFCKAGDLAKITVLREIEISTGPEAYKLEQYYLTLFNEYRYKGPPILKSKGNGEILTYDILGLDTQLKAS